MNTLYLVNSCHGRSRASGVFLCVFPYFSACFPGLSLFLCLRGRGLSPWIFLLTPLSTHLLIIWNQHTCLESSRHASYKRLCINSRWHVCLYVILRPVLHPPTSPSTKPASQLFYKGFLWPYLSFISAFLAGIFNTRLVFTLPSCPVSVFGFNLTKIVLALSWQAC